jgi:hypothetical protein
MVQQHLFASPKIDRTSEARPDAVLRFEPLATVRAIVFHLLDERVARSVAPETIDRTIARLTAKSIRPSIAWRRWVTLSNPQRLAWLLAESHTSMRIGENDRVRLQARRGR